MKSDDDDHVHLLLSPPLVVFIIILGHIDAMPPKQEKILQVYEARCSSF